MIERIPDFLIDNNGVFVGVSFGEEQFVAEKSIRDDINELMVHCLLLDKRFFNGLHNQSNY